MLITFLNIDRVLDKNGDHDIGGTEKKPNL